MDDFDKKFKIAGGMFAAWFVFCAVCGVALISLIIYILFRVAVYLS